MLISTWLKDAKKHKPTITSDMNIHDTATRADWLTPTYGNTNHPRAKTHHFPFAILYKLHGLTQGPLIIFIWAKHSCHKRLVKYMYIISENDIEVIMDCIKGVRGSCQYKDAIWPVYGIPSEDKAVLWPSSLYNANSHTWEDNLYIETEPWYTVPSLNP